jgi:hypothetical protein
VSGSSEKGKEAFSNWLCGIAENLHTILDAGAGSGTYKKLFDRLVSEGRIQNKNIRWIAAEPFQNYIESFHLRDLYDEVLPYKLQDVLNHSPPFDLIILGDVLEHLPLEEALSFLRQLKSKFDPLVFLSIPILYYPQDEAEGNILEKHLHHWHFNEVLSRFQDVGFFMTGEKAVEIGVFRNWMSFQNSYGSFVVKNSRGLVQAHRVCDHCSQLVEADFELLPESIDALRDIKSPSLGLQRLASNIPVDFDLR